MKNTASMKKHYAEVPPLSIPEMADFVSRVISNPKAYGVHRCILCRNPATGMGQWIPDAAHQKKVGANPEYIRTVLYGICDACLADGKKTAMLEIEKRIIQDVRGNVQ